VTCLPTLAAGQPASATPFKSHEVTITSCRRHLSRAPLCSFTWDSGAIGPAVHGVATAGARQCSASKVRHLSAVEPTAPLLPGVQRSCQKNRGGRQRRGMATPAPPPPQQTWVHTLYRNQAAAGCALDSALPFGRAPEARSRGRAKRQQALLGGPRRPPCRRGRAGVHGRVYHLIIALWIHRRRGGGGPGAAACVHARSQNPPALAVPGQQCTKQAPKPERVSSQSLPESTLVAFPGSTTPPPPPTAAAAHDAATNIAGEHIPVCPSALAGRIFLAVPPPPPTPPNHHWSKWRAPLKRAGLL
jgi:hypothetical protein